MNHYLAAAAIALAAASAADAQVVYYPVTSGYVTHTAYPDSWNGGPPIASPGGYHQYATHQPTYYETPVQAHSITHTHSHTHSHGHATNVTTVVSHKKLLVPTYRTGVGNHRLIGGPCGWGTNCTTYDGDNFTYIHPAQQ